MIISEPELLTDNHQLELFDSGIVTLDQWLKNRALKNNFTGASKTYVVCNENRVLAYYSLAASAIVINSAPGHFKRNMPNPIPVIVLGRLAVDQRLQRKGIGRALVQDAALRVIQAADLIGVRGMIIHALSGEAKSFYETIGFEPSPLDPMLLMATLADLKIACITD
ncbi:GNAT family N-acetyltransferase [Xenorhabdus khoisanae]